MKTGLWHILPAERKELYSPIGLKPIDEITGNAPIGWIRSFLDVTNGLGGWLETDIKPKFTPGGVIVYPTLGRSVDASSGQRRYRVRIEAEFYLPLYRAAHNAIEFDVFYYSDNQPPSNLTQIRTTQPQDLLLTPRPNYQFPSHIPVLRGVVKDATANFVPDATVSLGNKERVLSDSSGNFALPLRWTTAGQISIDAHDQRRGLSGTINIQFPQDLRRGHLISIQ